MRSPYFQWRNTLSKPFVNRVLKYINQVEFQEGSVGGSNGYVVNTEVRRSKTYLYNWQWAKDGVEREICLEMLRLAREANDHYEFKIDYSDFTIQLTQYFEDDKGEYNWHEDNSVLETGYYRKLSLAAPIKMCKKGGEFEIHTGCPDFIQEPGNVIAFPSFMSHKVNPVIKGHRISIVAWFYGPQWS